MRSCMHPGQQVLKQFVHRHAYYPTTPSAYDNIEYNSSVGNNDMLSCRLIKCTRIHVPFALA